jgi:hypothetical protein
MGSDLVIIARFTSPGHHQLLLGGTPLWRCVQRFLFSCKASLPDCLDPTDLWLYLLDLLSCDAVAAAWLHQELHVDSFNPAAVPFCMPWLLDPFCICPLVPALFVLLCAGSLPAAAVFSGLACYVLLVEASVADAALPAGERVLAATMVHSCLRLLSRWRPRPVFPGVAPPSFRPFGGAEAEPLLG